MVPELEEKQRQRELCTDSLSEMAHRWKRRSGNPERGALYTNDAPEAGFSLFRM